MSQVDLSTAERQQLHALGNAFYIERQIIAETLVRYLLTQNLTREALKALANLLRSSVDRFIQ